MSKEKSFEDLLRSRRIHRERVSPAEIQRALKRAEQDMQTAQMVMNHDWDWGFAITYNAVLQASRAYMFSQGYRPASAQGHKNTFAFMSLAMGKDYKNTITYFDRMRKKRNKAVYDIAGLITESEVKTLFTMATEFIDLIREKLGHTE